MIYFMQPTCGGPIKIGCSGNLDRRRRELAGYYGQRFTLLKSEPGNIEDEKAMHLRFADLRIGETEFFQPGPELTDYVGVPRHLGDYRAVSAIPMSRHAKNQKLIMRSSRKWRDWLDRAARERNCELSLLVREALKVWAKKEKVDQPPEE